MSPNRRGWGPVTAPTPPGSPERLPRRVSSKGNGPHDLTATAGVPPTPSPQGGFRKDLVSPGSSGGSGTRGSAKRRTESAKKACSGDPGVHPEPRDFSVISQTKGCRTFGRLSEVATGDPSRSSLRSVRERKSRANPLVTGEIGDLRWVRPGEMGRRPQGVTVPGGELRILRKSLNSRVALCYEGGVRARTCRAGDPQLGMTFTTEQRARYRRVSECGQ